VFTVAAVEPRNSLPAPAQQVHRDLADPARSRFRVVAEPAFAGVTHFHRVFRGTHGCTPAGLRRESGAGPGGPGRPRPGAFAPV